MSPENLNHQLQQQQQPQRQQFERTIDALVEELLQKKHKLNQLMAEASQKRARNGEFRLRLQPNKNK